MKHPAFTSPDDNPQLISCHIQNIRQLVGRLAAYNMKHEPAPIVRLVPRIIENAQKIDALAAQLVGAQHHDARRNQETSQEPV